MHGSISRWTTAALDLIAPRACLACGGGFQVRAGLCDACLVHVRTQPRDPCARCAAPLGPGADPSACVACAALRPKFVAAVAAGPYAGFLGELIRRSKYGRDDLLAFPLGELLAASVAAWPARAGLSAVVPVPGTPSRTRDRGFNLADLVGDRIARELALPLRDDWIVRVGEPVPQAALPRSKRRVAARGTVAMRAPTWLRPAPRLAGETVLLVDDVLTTGATANECARVLLAAGAAGVRVAVCTRA